MSISTKYEGVGQRRKIFTPGKVQKKQLNLSEENVGVVNEHHPRSMPRTKTNNSAKSLVNGAKLEYGGKRVLFGGSESLAKRLRNNFDEIKNFWVGKERVSRNNSISLKNATHTAKTDLEPESETDQQLASNLRKIKDGE